MHDLLLERVQELKINKLNKSTRRSFTEFGCTYFVKPNYYCIWVWGYIAAISIVFQALGIHG